MSTLIRLLLPAQIVSDLFAQAAAELPNECCGLLAGILEGEERACVTRRYPLANTAASPILYRNADKDLFAAFRDMRECGLDHLAIYHSHPTSAAVPSKTDRENNFYGSQIVHFIISLQEGTPTMRGWRLTADAATEAEWEIEG